MLRLWVQLELKDCSRCKGSGVNRHGTFYCPKCLGTGALKNDTNENDNEQTKDV